MHWCACGCIRSLALCAEDAIAAHCAEHLVLYMFVDALAAHCAEHILLYIRHVFRPRKFMLALTLGSSALSSSYRVGLAGRLHHLLRAAASARMASDFGEPPWESPELAGDDSQADSVSTVPVRRPANAAPPSPDSIWTQASSLSFRSLGPKPQGHLAIGRSRTGCASRAVGSTLEALRRQAREAHPRQHASAASLRATGTRWRSLL